MVNCLANLVTCVMVTNSGSIFHDLDTIGGYGICSNTMALPSAADHVSLTDIIKACSNPSNFVAAQVPFNLYEREAIVGSENDERKSVAEIAKVCTRIYILYELVKERERD